MRTPEADVPDDPRVRELLDVLSDQEATPEEVCGHCPELLPVVRARWSQICRARAELDALLPVHPEASFPLRGPQEESLPPLPGYQVDAVLGRGGMGIVFRARHLKLGRLVAVKMSLAGSYASEHERERFRREAEAVAALRHSNVVQVYDVGDLEGRPYFTMELMEGGSLAQRQAGEPQPARQAAALVATLAEAVHAAHQGGIVHRDLKPSNILFTPDGTPKITDFGLARRLEGNAALTLSGVPVGTPSYMAPEQARGQSREIGPAADVYALGAILYELLTGRPPFRGETSTETLLQVIHHEPVPPARLNRKVPRDLQTICLMCLQKEPQLRYVTAATLADDLQYFLRGEAITARPEAFLAKCVRRVCRQPVLAAAVLVAALSTLAFAGSGLWLLSDRSAKAQAAHGDVREMVRALNQSSWQEAGAARDRANGRLGQSAPAALRQLIERGTRDLELASRLDSFHAKGVEAIAGGTPLADYDKEFMDALRAADLGTFGDSPEVVARQIRESHIREALIAALDWYSIVVIQRDPARGGWALEVARKADPDQSDWRHRARDQKTLNDRAALEDLITSRPTAAPSMIPLSALEAYLSDRGYPVADRLKLLKQLHEAHPGDFWLNLRMGGFMIQNRMKAEALGYIQTAVALRPGSGIAHYQFGYVLSEVGRREDAAEQFRLATASDPTVELYHESYVRRLSELGWHAAAAEHLRGMLRTHPESAFAHTELGRSIERQSQETDALASLTRAVQLEPTRLDSQKALRDYCLKHGKLRELQAALQTSLPQAPSQYTAWYGYAELCLFLGLEDEYRRARGELLARFGKTTDGRTAEQVSRLSLLLPASGDELATAVALSERALASDAAKTGGFHSYFLFARGLAEYRQGNLARTIDTMKGDASRVLGPAPRLVLAMALQGTGRKQEARQTLVSAVAAYDWRPQHCNSQDSWIYHVLRREAEQMIFPNLAAFLTGDAHPQDNDERLALLGLCQFTDRTVMLARIYEEAFTADPGLAESVSGHRYAAARAAACAGSGRGSDAAGLDEKERSRWRGQALRWLREELRSADAVLEKSTGDARVKILQRLRRWLTEEDLAPLREPRELDKLPADERERCQTLWSDLQAVLSRSKS